MSDPTERLKEAFCRQFSDRLEIPAENFARQHPGEISLDEWTFRYTFANAEEGPALVVLEDHPRAWASLYMITPAGELLRLGDEPLQQADAPPDSQEHEAFWSLVDSYGLPGGNRRSGRPSR